MIALPRGLRRDTPSHGFERLVIERADCTAELFFHGASLTRWTPAGHRDVLFTSERAVYRSDKPIRGGVPICFPWFGPREGAGQHGFARTAAWRLASVEEDGPSLRIVLELDGDGTHPAFPHRFVARYAVTLGEKLECSLAVENTGDRGFDYEDALHTYFAVQDVRSVRVRGLEGQRYLDRSGGGEVAKISEDAPFAITGETDRLYLATTTPIEIEDGDRRIIIGKDGSHSTVVWNPWSERVLTFADLGPDEWTRMLCVEPANARSDRRSLAPGESRATRMRVTVNFNR